MENMPSEKPSRLLWRVSDGSRALYLLSFVFMLLAVFLNFLLPQLVRFLVDNVIGGLPVSSDLPLPPGLTARLGAGGAQERELIWTGLLVVAVAALGGLCTFVYARSLAAGAEGIIRRLRDRLFDHILRLPYAWHVKVMTGDIIQRCTSDVEVVRNFIANQLMQMARTIVLVVFAYSLLFPINLNLSLASIVFLPVIVIYSFTFMQKIADRYLAAAEAEGELLSAAQENFTGVRVVRAFGRERYEVDRFDKHNRRFADLWMRLGDVFSTFWGLGDFMTGMQMITICAVGALEAAAGRITPGEFIVFLTYNSMLIWPVRSLGRVLSEASKTGVSLGRIQEILDTPPETDAADALDTPLSGDVVFEHVSFSYDGQPVLRDVSFRVEEGTTLGILGSTGSGKTTVAHLLCRLYDLPEDGGRITIGGVDIRRYQRGFLRRNIGIVLQEPFLYSRSIRDNIAALSSAWEMDEIRKAAQIACVDDAILSFERSYDTVVGERGVTLSGGQKQRVAIARTLLGKPPILVFDDSLSAVDTETDLHIRRGLAEATERVTTLIISHRITSLAGADKVIVMDGGKILEMGSPAELRAQNGVYRRIHDLQESVEQELADEMEQPEQGVE